jgi:hypothetical protein
MPTSSHFDDKCDISLLDMAGFWACGWILGSGLSGLVGWIGGLAGCVGCQQFKPLLVCSVGSSNVVLLLTDV